MKVLRNARQSLYVWRNIQLVKSRVLLLAILFISATILFAMDLHIYSSIALIIVPIAYFGGIYSYQSYLIWTSGSEGEKSVLKSLNALPDDYLVLNGLVVPPNRGDLDHIVIGPNGLFVVEDKNYGGRISCVGDEWTKSRRGINQEEKELFIGSPSRQVKRNSKVLKDFVLTHQRKIFHGRAPHIWVNSILVFTNPNAMIELESPTVEVVDIDDLSDFILNLKSTYVLSKSQIQRIGKTLIKYSN